ncbi:hypothetical protein ARMSODRAFT_982559 [Armillaria solidipes]|uniref:Uncharacterized protein n=1 Tax=Armillaria solidipes TaxID=1076256 RepID=A0A2H3AMM4_9AGAR|nr:hypothetical protein ARMSODRAFT_982559 [Armillaria solidipes]
MPWSVFDGQHCLLLLLVFLSLLLRANIPLSSVFTQMLIHISCMSLISFGPALTAALVAIQSFMNMRRVPSQARKLAFIAKLTIMVGALLTWMPTISIMQLPFLTHYYLWHAKWIEHEVNSLYYIILDHMLECNEILQGLVDGLNAIAACKRGTAIINQYAEAHELVCSLIVKHPRTLDAASGS